MSDVPVDGISVPVDVNTAAEMVKSGAAYPRSGGQIALSDPYGERALGSTFFSGSAIKGSLTLPFAGRDDALLSYELLRMIARRSSIVKPPVDFVVRSLSGTPYRIRAMEGMRVPKKAIKRAEELFIQPLAEMGTDTFPDVLSKLLRDQMVLDQGLLLKHRGAGGGMEAFECMDAATFLPVQDETTGRLKKWSQRLKNGEERDYDIADIVNFIINRRSDSLFGEPPLEAAIHEVNAVLNASRSFSKAMNDNEIPPGVLFLAGADNTRAMARLERQVRRDRGISNDYALKVIAGIDRAQWVPFQRPYHEMQVVELLERLERIIFRVFGVDRIAMGCHSEDTQVLTRDGWKYHYEVSEGSDLLATYAPDGQITYAKPVKKYEYEYSGPMVSFRTRDVDALVTPNHRMYASRRKLGENYGDYEFLEAETMGEGRYRFPASGYASGEQQETIEVAGQSYNMNDWLEFLGLLVSEGSIYSEVGKGHVIQFGASKADTIGAIRSVLERLRIKFHEFEIPGSENFDGHYSQPSIQFKIWNKALCEALIPETGKTSKEKRLPDFIWDLPSHQLEVLFQSLVLGDGHVNDYGRGSGSYTTISEQLANDMQRLALLLGYRPNIHRSERLTVVGNQVYTVNFAQMNHYGIQADKGQVDAEVPYDGVVWCYEVEPHHTLITRREGKVLISGNSAQDVNRCHSADTEILTENGWKNYWDVLEGERIATMNPQTKALEFHVPNQMFLNSYQGKMLHFTGRQLDMVVTPNHRMWVRSGANSNRVGQGPSQYEFIEAGSLSAKHPYLMPVSFQADDQPDQDEFVLPGAKTFGGPNGDYPERVIEMDTFVRFIGYFVSEGHAGVHHGRYVVNLSQNTDSPYTSSMGQVISSVPAKFVARDDNQGVRRWVVSDKALNTWLRENCGELARSKKLPELWKTLSHRQLNLMYQALIDGDGTRSSRDNSKSVTYYTASKTLADQVQQVAMKLGHRAHVREHNYPGYENGYRVLITENTPESRIRNSVQEVDYDGKVFCFDVPPNHLMVTRRNGTVAITGNSTAEAMLMTRHFSLFKPLLDIWANKFTFEVLKEIHEGLFIEFIHFARTGMETDLIGVGPTGSISDEVMQAGPGGGDGGDDEKLFGGRALPCGGCNGHGYSTFYYNGEPDRIECPDCGGRGRGGPVFVSRPNHGRFAIPEGLNRMRNLRKNPSKAWEELAAPGMREKLRGAVELTRRQLISAAESVDSSEDMIVVGRMIRKSLGELFEAAYDTASEVARKAGVKVSRESLNNANTHVYDLVRFQVNRPVLNGADHQEVAIHAADDCAALCDLATQVAGSTLLDAVERAA